MNFKPITLRRMAAIREMASLGCGGAEISRLLKLKPTHVSVIACQAKVSLLANRRETPLRASIRAGYEKGLPPAVIAAETGRPESSIKVIASKMGLTRCAPRDPFKHRRPFKVPADRMAEYMELRKLGLTFRECGYEMGLLERPQAKMRLAA